MTSKVFSLNEEELLNGKETAPGRIRTYILENNKETLPPSCTLFVWNGDLFDCISFICRALKFGAGVKLIFPKDFHLAKPCSFEWLPYITSANKDYEEFYSLKYDYTANFIKDKIVSVVSIILEDSMEGETGIISSIGLFIENCLQGKDSFVDFSLLRPKGTVNNKGLIASGSPSFLTIFIQIVEYLKIPSMFSLLKLLGTINDVMRRGGYKKGIVTSSIDYRSSYCLEYLQIPITEIDGSHKKGVRIDSGILQEKVILEETIRSCNEESTFLAKIRNDNLYENVCNGIILGDRATCLIWRVNLGKCNINNVVKAFRDATLNLVELHFEWRKRSSLNIEIFAKLEDDRQVALDVMGLANLLALNEITYKEFNDNLEDFLDNDLFYTKFDEDLNAVQFLIKKIALGYIESVYVADRLCKEFNLPKLDRLHCVEPAQFHSYETEDAEGNTTCRGIWPPVGKIVNRTSNIERNIKVFHGEVEDINDVGLKEYYRTNVLWQRLMNVYGRPHAISMDWYEPASVKEIFRFLESPLQTKYYSVDPDQTYLKKVAGIAEINEEIQCDCNQ